MAFLLNGKVNKLAHPTESFLGYSYSFLGYFFGQMWSLKHLMLSGEPFRGQTAEVGAH